jgi:large subunit ribosomal protein L29
MKTKEIRELTDAEAQAKLRDLRQELFNLRLQQHGARLERPSRIRDVRRDIARAETILRERQLNHAPSVMKAASAMPK